MFNTIEEAIKDLQTGKPVIVADDEDRENEGDLVALSEKATPDMINFMITHGRGLVCTAIRADLAANMQLPLMTREKSDPFETAFTVSLDHTASKTGISAVERSETIQALLDPDARPADFKRPGHVFPLIAKDGGVLKRQGHTEASVDLAKLSGAFPSGVICEIINDDGTMARVPDLYEMAQRFQLKLISVADLVNYRKQQETHISREAKAVLPTEFGSFSIYGYTNTRDHKEHIALVKGDVNRSEPVLVRVHSECLTGDVFGSHRCDCGPQLQKALRHIHQAGTGVVVYMRQEGRGIGLINKLRAYQLQDRGLDTVEANEHLGFAPDERDYALSAQILKDLGADNVNLMTNNPEKLKALAAYGIRVNTRIPLETDLTSENEHYMRTKAEKMGHWVSLSQN